MADPKPSRTEIRQHVRDLIRTSFDIDCDMRPDERVYFDETVKQILNDEAQDLDLRREIMGFYRCFVALDARLLGRSDITSKQRLSFFRIYDYADDRIKGVRRLLDKITAESDDEKLVKWIMQMGDTGRDELRSTTPEGLLQDFIEIAFANFNHLKN
jgi:hypothetical protein